MPKYNYFNNILSACLSSSKADKITLCEDNGKCFLTRAQLHALIVQPFGTGKTTSMVDMDPKKVFQLTKFTESALLGTITPDGEFMPGAISNSAGKTLFIDEYHNLARNAKWAMLQLLEHQKYDRSLGYHIKTGKFSSSKKYIKIKAKRNVFSTQARFSCICSGIEKFNESSNDRAWLSRFVPVEYNTELADVFNLVRGRAAKKIKIYEWNESPVFEDYMKFVDKYEKVVLGLNFIDKFDKYNMGFIARNVLDMARLASFFSRDNGTVDDWERVLAYVPYALHGYVASRLTLKEYRIMQLFLDGSHTPHEIRDEIGCSDTYVYNTKMKLQGMGLL